MKLTDEQQKRIESEITASVLRVDAVSGSDAEFDAICEEEALRLADMMQAEGVETGRVVKVIDKMRELTLKNRDDARSLKMLKAIRQAEKLISSTETVTDAGVQTRQEFLGEIHRSFFTDERATNEELDVVGLAIAKLSGIVAEQRGIRVEFPRFKDLQADTAFYVDAVSKQYGTDAAGLKRLWQQDFDDLCSWARVLGKQWTAPPTEQCVTAANTEAYVMAVTHATAAIEQCEYLKGSHEEDASVVLAGVCRVVPEFDRVTRRLERYVDLMGNESDTFFGFAGPWRDSSYARLEIGHKLAAALCMTDSHDVEVKSPWKACSVVVPDGLFPPFQDGSQVARLWCVGTTIHFAVLNNGVVVIPGNLLLGRTQAPNGFQEVLDNLVRGAYLALSNPDEFKKQKTSSASGSRKNQRSGPPDLAQVRYMLSAPVSIDLREELRDHLSGQRKGGGGSPKVQFLVRGHWRQQAHGPNHSLRKDIWIKPFWKGDEEARVLLRNYVVKDDEKKNGSVVDK